MFLTVDGIRLHTVCFGGGGRTLAAVGGWTGDWELWEQPFELLTPRGWRCISWDHRGAGESPAPPAEITVDALVADVFAVLDAFEVDRCILGGESMGGEIALRAAALAPERFEGLVLVDPAPPVFGEGRAAFAAAVRADYPETARSFIDNCLPEPDSEHVRRWGRDILARAEPEQAAALIEMWRDAPPAPPPAAVPTLVVHGALDTIVPLAYARELAERLPDAELLVIEEAGHVPTMTRPHEVVDAILRRFG
jgi:pimeloyl-ACP methyl ester carboxylesterase